MLQFDRAKVLIALLSLTDETNQPDLTNRPSFVSDL
jgi:hypothetical protein